MDKISSSKIFKEVCERRKSEWGHDNNVMADCGVTLGRSTLMLVGGKGSSTAFHVDWSEAINCALAIVRKSECKKVRPHAAAAHLCRFIQLTTKARRAPPRPATQSLVLARWTLIHPSAAIDAYNWMRNQGFKASGGKAAWLSTVLSPEQVEKLTAHLKQLPALSHIKSPILVLEQRAGDIIDVAPGWAHQVENLATCVKVAWDCVVPENLPLYMEVMHSIRAHLNFDFNKENGDDGGDYLNLSGIMLRAIATIE